MYLAVILIVKKKHLSLIGLENIQQTALVLLQVVLTSAEHSAEGSWRALLISAKYNRHSKATHCRIGWSFPALLPKVSHDCYRIRCAIPTFVLRSLTTAVKKYGSFRPLARALIPAANFSFFREELFRI